MVVASVRVSIVRMPCRGSMCAMPMALSPRKSRVTSSFRGSFRTRVGRHRWRSSKDLTMSRITVATMVAAIVAIASDAAAMSNYRWKYRPLLVFADGAASAALAQQRAIVAASRTGLAERKVVVVWVIGDAVNSELGPAPAQSAGALRARFGASNCFLPRRTGRQRRRRKAVAINAAGCGQIVRHDRRYAYAPG